jgi:hypothetical protein
MKYVKYAGIFILLAIFGSFVLNLNAGMNYLFCIVFFLLFVIDPIRIYISMAFSFPYVAIIIFIAIHIYTVIIAFQHSVLEGILTVILFGISQVYWVLKLGIQNGFLNLYNIIVFAYLLLLIQSQIVIIFSRNKLRKSYANEQLVEEKGDDIE